MDCCGKFLARQQSRACGFPAICEELKLQESHSGDCCYPSPIRVTLCLCYYVFWFYYLDGNVTVKISIVQQQEVRFTWTAMRNQHGHQFLRI